MARGRLLNRPHPRYHRNQELELMCFLSQCANPNQSCVAQSSEFHIRTVACQRSWRAARNCSIRIWCWFVQIKRAIKSTTYSLELSYWMPGSCCSACESVCSHKTWAGSRTRLLNQSSFDCTTYRFWLHWTFFDCVRSLIQLQLQIIHSCGKLV